MFSYSKKSQYKIFCQQIPACVAAVLLCLMPLSAIALGEQSLFQHAREAYAAKNEVALAQDLEELNKSEKFSDHKKAIISDVADMIAKSSSSKTLGEDVINLIVIGLVERVLDDIFSTEEQQKLLEKTKALPELITGKKPQPELNQ